MNASNEVLAALTQRVDTLEAALQAVMQKLADKKPRTTGPLDDAEKEARRLRVNEQSRLSKEKSRAAAVNMTVEEYREHMAAKKAKAPTLLQAAGETLESEAVPASRTVVEYDADAIDQPTAAEASQERTESTDNLPSEAGDLTKEADPTSADQVPAAKNRKKK